MWADKARIVAKAGKVPMIWGPPGIGKTDMVYELVHKRIHPDKPCVVVSPSLEDPTTATGPLAVIADKAVRLLPEVMKPLIEAGGGTLFIDEFTTATQATQAAFLRLVQNRVVGDTPLPDSVIIILAANPADVAAGGSSLVIPMANRVCHIEADPPSAVEWGKWLKAEMSSDEHAERAAEIFASFIESNPAKILMFPNNEDDRAKAWPSPRTLHAAALVYAEALREDDPVTGISLIAGCVGEGLGKEIVAYIREANIPKASDILSGKIDWHPNEKADVTLMVLRSLANEATRKVKAPEGMAASERADFIAKVRADRAHKVQVAWRFFRRVLETRGQTDKVFLASKNLAEWRNAEARDAGFPNRFDDENFCLDRFEGVNNKTVQYGRV